MFTEQITIKYDADSWGSPWVATFASYDGPGSPIGTGETPVEALEALLEMAGIDV
jgi:hypothetical protein